VPFSFILALITIGLGLLIVPAVAVSLRNAKSDSYGSRGEPLYSPAQRRRIVLATAIGFGLLAGFLVFLAAATIVPTRSVGVEVSFGKPIGQLDNGFHLVAPWHKVEKFDTSVQTLVMKGDGQGADNPCVTVRLGNQTTACVDVNRSQWNIDPAGDVVELYRRYKAFERIEQNVVAGQTMNALVGTFADFDPLAGVTGQKDAPTKGTDALAADALKRVQGAVGTGIRVESLLLFVNYDPTTQNKLNDYAKALAETRIAAQSRLTAEEQAKANKALAAQASVRDPGVQYQNCLSLVRDLAARDQLGKLPPTFNCGDPRSQVIVNGGER
jgi:regulator of protease activity HflC (stomatin/prohibitin superfamily)